MIYLDNNATTPVTSEVLEAMIPFFSEKFLNPGSLAGELNGVDRVLAQTKQALAHRLGGLPEEFVLTSGATESNNWVLRALAQKHLSHSNGFNLVISSTEHPSVLETAKDLEQIPGVNLNFIDVNDQGELLEKQLIKMVTPETHLLSIILANNESGVVHDIASLSRQVKVLSPHCLIHTDATQAVGKMRVDLCGELKDVDLLSLSAHKFHGPKGIGSLFIRNTVVLPPFITGGNQQKGLRSGTENPALAAGMKAALESFDKQACDVELIRDQFEERLIQAIPSIRILAKNTRRLPNTSMIVLPDLEGELAVSMLYQNGVIASTGSACLSGADKPSHVATAMGISFSDAWRVLRISFGSLNRVNELDHIISAIKNVVLARS